MKDGGVEGQKPPKIKKGGLPFRGMRVNMERSFRPGECPLAGERVLEVMAL